MLTISHPRRMLDTLTESIQSPSKRTCRFMPLKRSLPRSCVRFSSIAEWARDYYDIWRILGAYQDRLDLADFERLVRAKCDLRRVDFRGPDDFFDDVMPAYVERTWSQWLGNLVPEVPTFSTVIGQIRPRSLQSSETAKRPQKCIDSPDEARSRWRGRPPCVETPVSGFEGVP